MPRKSKGARLWERKRKGRESVWVIKDEGGFEKSTGTSCLKDAEIQLAQHIAGKARPSGPVTADEITVGEILAVYATEYAHSVADPARIAYAIEALDPFWGDQKVSAVKGATCRRYVSWRDRAPDTMRRELGVLRSALNYCAQEGYLVSAPIVTLPDKPEVAERFLTRQQAAILLIAARRLRIDGRQQMIRFILASIYTGTRKSATLALCIDLPSTNAGWIDTERGILFRKGVQERGTAKRRRPAKCPNKLLSHVKRWKRNGARYVCEDHKGRRVANVKTAWDRLAEIATQIASEAEIEFPDRKQMTPHILKHTAITWAIQNGASIEDAASFFSTSTATIERVYWHHSPRFQQSVVDAIDKPAKTPF